jgi:hypothetical protein
MEIQQTESTLIEEPSIADTNFEIQTNIGHGKLLLTTENISLAEEIKILIRKLWS